MRLGVLGPQDPDSFADNISDTLERQGHTVCRLGGAMPQWSIRHAEALGDMAARSVGMARSWQSRKVRRALQRELDVVINVDARMLPESVARLRRGGIAVAFWFPDGLHRLDRQLMLASPYSSLFFKDRELVRRLQRMSGLPVFYLPEACNSSWHSVPGTASGGEGCVVLAGEIYPARSMLVQHLADKGVPLVVYGSGVPRWLEAKWMDSVPIRARITRYEKAKVFRSAVAVLNTLHPGEMAGMNCRLFEAAGSGGAVVTEARDCLVEYFEPGREVLAYSSLAELDSILDQLLRAGGAIGMGDLASRRAHSEHTYERRLDELLARTV